MKDDLNLFPLPKQDIPDNKKIFFGKRKLLQACRNQIEMRISSLDELISEDHPARIVWNYVEDLDLSKSLNYISFFEGFAGRPAIDPKILVSLWLYATIEGIGSARVLARYTKEHMALNGYVGMLKLKEEPFLTLG